MHSRCTPLEPLDPIALISSGCDSKQKVAAEDEAKTAMMSPLDSADRQCVARDEPGTYAEEVWKGGNVRSGNCLDTTKSCPLVSKSFRSLVLHRIWQSPRPDLASLNARYRMVVAGD
jgi:hypothetical protein